MCSASAALTLAPTLMQIPANLLCNCFSLKASLHGREQTKALRRVFLSSLSTEIRRWMEAEGYVFTIFMIFCRVLSEFMVETSLKMNFRHRA